MCRRSLFSRIAVLSPAVLLCLPNPVCALRPPSTEGTGLEELNRRFSAVRPAGLEERTVKLDLRVREEVALWSPFPGRQINMKLMRVQPEKVQAEFNVPATILVFRTEAWGQALAKFQEWGGLASPAAREYFESLVATQEGKGRWVSVEWDPRQPLSGAVLFDSETKKLLAEVSLSHSLGRSRAQLSFKVPDDFQVARSSDYLMQQLPGVLEQFGQEHLSAEKPTVLVQMFKAQLRRLRGEARAAVKQEGWAGAEPIFERMSYILQEPAGFQEPGLLRQYARWHRWARHELDLLEIYRMRIWMSVSDADRLKEALALGDRILQQRPSPDLRLQRITKVLMADAVVRLIESGYPFQMSEAEKMFTDPLLPLAYTFSLLGYHARARMVLIDTQDRLVPTDPLIRVLAYGLLQAALPPARHLDQRSYETAADSLLWFVPEWRDLPEEEMRSHRRVLQWFIGRFLLDRKGDLRGHLPQDMVEEALMPYQKITLVDLAVRASLVLAHIAPSGESQQMFDGLAQELNDRFREDSELGSYPKDRLVVLEGVEARARVDQQILAGPLGARETVRWVRENLTRLVEKQKMDAHRIRLDFLLRGARGAVGNRWFSVEEEGWPDKLLSYLLKQNKENRLYWVVRWNSWQKIGGATGKRVLVPVLVVTTDDPTRLEVVDVRPGGAPTDFGDQPALLVPLEDEASVEPAPENPAALSTDILWRMKLAMRQQEIERGIPPERFLLEAEPKESYEFFRDVRRGIQFFRLQQHQRAEIGEPAAGLLVILHQGIWSREKLLRVIPQVGGVGYWSNPVEVRMPGRSDSVWMTALVDDAGRLQIRPADLERVSLLQEQIPFLVEVVSRVMVSVREDESEAGARGLEDLSAVLEQLVPSFRPQQEREPEPGLRQALVKGLAVRRYGSVEQKEKVWRGLARLLTARDEWRDPDDQVRKVAVKGLGLLTADGRLLQAALAVVEDVLEKDKSPEVKVAAQEVYDQLQAFAQRFPPPAQTGLEEAGRISAEEWYLAAFL